MNEVKNINLSRSEFVIAHDAYKELNEYLEAVKKHVGSTEVVDEIEARMAELLLDNRTITKDRVVLKADVDFIKQQLGKPTDFDEANSDEAKSDKNEKNNSGKFAETRKLMRNPDGQIIGGVASGLGVYFNADPIWFRLLFIAMSISGGFGVVVYIILWVVLPEAKTESDKLAMRGLPVTIENIKERVESLDLAGKTNEITGRISTVFTAFARGIVKLFGISILTMTSVLILLTLTATNYIFFSDLKLNGVKVFPVGMVEKFALGFSSAATIIFLSLIVITALKIIERKPVVKNRTANWLAVLFFLFLSLGVSLLGNAAPKINNRIRSANIYESRQVETFYKIGEVNGTIEINYGHNLYEPRPGITYHVVNIKANPKTDLSKLKTVVRNGVLDIDATALDSTKTCETICITPDPIIESAY